MSTGTGTGTVPASSSWGFELLAALHRAGVSTEVLTGWNWIHGYGAGRVAPTQLFDTLSKATERVMFETLVSKYRYGAAS